MVMYKVIIQGVLFHIDHENATATVTGTVQIRHLLMLCRYGEQT
jgi:hypothetical protein